MILCQLTFPLKKEPDEKIRPRSTLFSLLITLGLLLSSCGTDEEFYDEAYATEEAATEEVFTDATEAPAAKSAPGEIVYDLGFTRQEDGFTTSAIMAMTFPPQT